MVVEQQNEAKLVTHDFDIWAGSGLAGNRITFDKPATTFRLSAPLTHSIYTFCLKSAATAKSPAAQAFLLLLPEGPC